MRQSNCFVNNGFNYLLVKYFLCNNIRYTSCFYDVFLFHCFLVLTALKYTHLGSKHLQTVHKFSYIIHNKYPAWFFFFLDTTERLSDWRCVLQGSYEGKGFYSIYKVMNDLHSLFYKITNLWSFKVAAET